MYREEFVVQGSAEPWIYGKEVFEWESQRGAHVLRRHNLFSERDKTKGRENEWKQRGSAVYCEAIDDVSRPFYFLVVIVIVVNIEGNKERA